MQDMISDIIYRHLYKEQSKNFLIWSKLLNGRLLVNLQASVAQKIADEVVFRHFQGEWVEFF